MSFVSTASSGRPLTRLSRASSISSSSYSSTSCAAAESTPGFNFNETSFTINDVLTVTTNAQFFADTTIAVEKDRESRSRHAALKNRKAKSNGSNLNSIDEDKEIDNDDIVKEKKVKLTSLIIPHGGNNCARYVSKNLHQAITEHPNFTSLVKMPEVFRDAFVQIDELFMNTEEANDDSGCSVICAIITPSNGICVAHVGEARGIIRGTDGTISELTSPHVIESSSKEKTRLKKNGAFISSDNKLFGKLSYSRSFGHKYLKQEFPGSLICLPNVIQIQMNINTETSPITRSISTSSERSSRNLKSQKKETRNDVLMVLGSSTIWKNLNDKKMCSSLTASLFNGSSLTEAVSSMISLRKSNPLMFWRERDTSMDQNVPKGLYVVNWVSYSAA